jgi:hypothetical protein
MTFWFYLSFVMTAAEKKHVSGIGYIDLKLLVWLWLLSATRL